MGCPLRSCDRRLLVAFSVLLLLLQLSGLQINLILERDLVDLSEVLLALVEVMTVVVERSWRLLPRSLLEGRYHELGSVLFLLRVEGTVARFEFLGGMDQFFFAALIDEQFLSGGVLLFENGLADGRLRRQHVLPCSRKGSL